jgi:hypothetical protein
MAERVPDFGTPPLHPASVLASVLVVLGPKHTRKHEKESKGPEALIYKPLSLVMLRVKSLNALGNRRSILLSYGRIKASEFSSEKDSRMARYKSLPRSFSLIDIIH